VFDIPLPFVVAFLLFLVLARLVLLRGEDSVDRATTLFVAICCVMSLLIGIRWTYDVPILRSVQPVIAALIPGVVWLCFSQDTTRKKVFAWLWHIVPAILILLLVMGPLAGREWIDVLLLVQFTGYGLALLRMALSGSDAMAGARLQNMQRAQRATYLAAFSLLGSGLIDVLVAVDFSLALGKHVPDILGVVNILQLALISLAVVISGSSRPVKPFPDASEAPELQSKGGLTNSGVQPDDALIVEAIEKLLRDKRIFTDPDLTLNRIARKAGIPARQISAAINRVHLKNVSQFINEYRINEAANLLVSSNLPITTIMFESGFQTKSNFNREFLRVKGKSPSDFRASGSSN
jgi:AraC-like DNA-binding protein